MKTILVPTDFSAVAKNATHYAAEMALVHKAKMVLCHVYQLPIVMGEIPVAIPPIEEIEADGVVALEKLEKHLHDRYGKELEIDYKMRTGFIADSILEIAEEIKADLIVVGMQGAGFIAEKIMGSNTTHLIQKSKIPVLAIDKQAHFKSIEHILYASDFEELEEKNTLAPLLELTKTFHADLHILHVIRQKEKSQTVTQAVEGIKLNRYFLDIEHEFHFIESETVLGGIQKFIRKKPMDIIVMVPRSHSFFDKLFNEPNSKQVAFHTHLPLLTLHE